MAKQNTNERGNGAPTEGAFGKDGGKNPQAGTHGIGTQPKSETARENGRSGKQTHENRENPDRDQVPGHKGYSRDNL